MNIVHQLNQVEYELKRLEKMMADHHWDVFRDLAKAQGWKQFLKQWHCSIYPTIMELNERYITEVKIKGKGMPWGLPHFK